MSNYDFCEQWIVDRAKEKSLAILDYGCGAGEIVRSLRKKGVDSYGCDLFYSGGDYSNAIEGDMLGSIIRRMDERTGSIPFDNNTFDLVISNQVIEHVQDLDFSLSDICRVLKPGGLFLSLFPDKGVWREGHCGIPFLHWFSKSNPYRLYYCQVFRALGFGYYKADKSVSQWSRDFCQWLDDWTHYRTAEEIEAAFSKHFGNMKHIEIDWFTHRLGSAQWVGRLLPSMLQTLVVRKLAGMVIVAENRTC